MSNKSVIADIETLKELKEPELDLHQRKCLDIRLQSAVEKNGI